MIALCNITFLRRENDDSRLQYHFGKVIVDYNIDGSRLLYHYKNMDFFGENRRGFRGISLTSSIVIHDAYLANTPTELRRNDKKSAEEDF